ncbi:hypothetical protein BDR04DRAFT_1175545 [Suillus decipiens]|nr:hypothetical protein BDR04DRAFT_1175545 [Suillus decipiens]
MVQLWPSAHVGWPVPNGTLSCSAGRLRQVNSLKGLVQVKTHLEDLLRQCTNTKDFTRRNTLRGLAEVAICKGRLSEAMNILQTVAEMFEGHNLKEFLWYTALKALVASKQGDYALSRELITMAPGLLQSFALRTAHVFLLISYSSACIELAADAYDRAQSHFIATIEGSDIQGQLTFKAYSKRGLGEIAFVHGDFTFRGWTLFLEGQDSDEMNAGYK